jgi:transposase-like protein
MADRAQVLAYAERHGSKAAAARFGVPAATIRSWRSRARRRAGREQADRERPPESASPAATWSLSPMADFEERAAQLAEWAARGVCLHCGGAGEIRVPAIQRGPVVIRWGKTIPCPTCGGRPVRIQVNELPREEWAEAMRRAGDMGIGWSVQEWAEIRAGNPNPLGYRWTHRDRIEVGPGGPVGPGDGRELPLEPPAPEPSTPTPGPVNPPPFDLSHQFQEQAPVYAYREGVMSAEERRRRQRRG